MDGRTRWGTHHTLFAEEGWECRRRGQGGPAFSLHLRKRKKSPSQALAWSVVSVRGKTLIKDDWRGAATPGTKGKEPKGESEKEGISRRKKSHDGKDIAPIAAPWSCRLSRRRDETTGSMPKTRSGPQANTPWGTGDDRPDWDGKRGINPGDQQKSLSARPQS